MDSEKRGESQQQKGLNLKYYSGGFTSSYPMGRGMHGKVLSIWFLKIGLGRALMVLKFICGS